MLGPIFNREWITLPRRPAHYFARGLYLGAMWVLVLTIWQVMVGWEFPPTVGDLARFGLISFRMLAFIQLTLLLFFSALAAASTVALEKDRRTFLLLLLTRLRNDEIVLGKLLGSLMQIGLLLLGSVPIFALLMTLGGIDPLQVVSAFVVLGATALAAGSLGSLVALWREKTFQALALTVLFLVLYLCLVEALPFAASLLESAPGVAVHFDPVLARRCQAALSPFHALALVTDPGQMVSDSLTLPGEVGDALDAALIYGAAALGLTVLLNVWAMARLRVWNPSGEPIMQREVLGATPAEPERVHAAPGKVRPVWANPILWREIATRAYGRRPLLVKTAYFVVLGLVAYYAFVAMDPRPWAAAYGLVPIGILSLLLISAQAVTSVTSERDLGSLDLLIITDITPKEFVYGKILGILYNTKEYILPPLVMVAVYAVLGKLGTYAIQGPLYLGLAIGVLIAFTVMLGIHVALRNDNTRRSAINTLGTVFFLSVGTMVCIYLILINGRFEYQWLSFAGFIVAGIGGLWWVLSAERPSAALNLASVVCPIAVFYTITNILIGKPTTGESTDPLIPLIVTGGAFGFALIAMAVPLMTEFDVAVGRSSAIGE